MSKLIENALEVEPGYYENNTREFKTINTLTQNEWTTYLDTLAKDGRTCQYNQEDDTFTVT